LEAARSLQRARSRIIANFCKSVDISVYTDDDNIDVDDTVDIQ